MLTRPASPSPVLTLGDTKGRSASSLSWFVVCVSLGLPVVSGLTFVGINGSSLLQPFHFCRVGAGVPSATADSDQSHLSSALATEDSVCPSSQASVIRLHSFSLLAFLFSRLLFYLGS